VPACSLKHDGTGQCGNHSLQESCEMKTKPGDNFEVNFLRAERILNDIKTGLMNLLPGESSLTKIAGAKNDPGLALQTGLFNFSNDKPQPRIAISDEKPAI
jgi:hypothetical protein